MTPSQQDTKRDAWLKTQGVPVMRVPATEVLRSAGDVADGLTRIAKEMAEGAAPPSTALTRGPPPP